MGGAKAGKGSDGKLEGSSSAGGQFSIPGGLEVAVYRLVFM